MAEDACQVLDDIIKRVALIVEQALTLCGIEPVGDVRFGREGEFPVVVAALDLVAGEDLGAGEKLILVCRLRSRGFLGAILTTLALQSASLWISHCLTLGLILRGTVACNNRVAQTLPYIQKCR